MAQVRASSPASALTIWARQLASQGVPGIGEATATALAERLREERPVPLDGLVNAWCASSMLRGAFALINIIRTGEDVR
jgi:hypothetical protein